MRTTVVGAGSWGTAFAAVLADAGHEVTMWGRRPEVCTAITKDHANPDYLPGIELAHGIRATDDPQRAIEHAEIVALAVPADRKSTRLNSTTLFRSRCRVLGHRLRCGAGRRRARGHHVGTPARGVHRHHEGPRQPGLPTWHRARARHQGNRRSTTGDRTRRDRRAGGAGRSEEHTSELHDALPISVPGPGAPPSLRCWQTPGTRSPCGDAGPRCAPPSRRTTPTRTTYLASSSRTASGQPTIHNGRSNTPRSSRWRCRQIGRAHV